jgi:hypothetical protein
MRPLAMIGADKLREYDLIVSLCGGMVSPGHRVSALLQVIDRRRRRRVQHLDITVILASLVRRPGMLDGVGLDPGLS